MASRLRISKLNCACKHPPPPRRQSSRTRQPPPTKLGTPAQQTQPRTPAPSPPSRHAASALRSSSSSKPNAELAAKYGAAAASLPPEGQKLPPKDPQTRQAGRAHTPARGPRRGGGSKRAGQVLTPFTAQQGCCSRAPLAVAPREGKTPRRPQAAPYPLAQGRAGRPGTLATSPAHRAARVRRAAYQAVVCPLRVAAPGSFSTRPATPTRPRRSCETPYAAGPRRWSGA